MPFAPVFCRAYRNQRNHIFYHIIYHLSLYMSAGDNKQNQLNRLFGGAYVCRAKSAAALAPLARH